MTTTHIDNTGNSVVAAAVDIMNSGVINFDTVGGDPTDQYRVEIESVVYQLDPNLAGTNYGATNPHGLEGSRTSGYYDLININPDISARTVEGTTGLIIHELYHESTLVNARSDDMTRQISDSLGGLSSTQEDVVRHIAEEITLRSMVEEIGRVNPEVDAQNEPEPPLLKPL